MEPAPQNISLAGERKLVEKISETASRFHIVSLARQIEVCEELVKNNPLIDVAILGQFKAGKSSFINSLVGIPVLPVGVIPVTTVITRIQYGARERASATFFDGTSSEMTLEDLGAYISEAGNPSNLKDVDVVDIELPYLAEYPGLRLVDTPGMGSVYRYHKEVSQNWLPEVGAAILAISADRPLSEHDLQLIEDLSHHTPRIVILLTKADLLNPAQQEEVVQFFQQTLKRKINREYPIFLYSIHTDTQILRDRIRTGILNELSMNRDQEFKRILLHKTQSLLRQCLSYLNIAMKTSLQADQDRESLHRQILNEKVGYDQIREEINVITNECQRQTRILLKNHLDRFQKSLSKKCTTRLSEEMPLWKGNLWKLTRRYEAWVTEVMEAEMRHLSKTENSHFYGTLNKAHTSLARYLEGFRMMLGENIQKVLGIKLAETEWKIEVVEPEKPDTKVMYSFDIHWDLIWFLIPMAIFRRLFERHFLKEIPWAVEVNLSRLAAQWETRINKAIDEIRAQALAYIKDEISTIDALLSESPDNTREIRELVSALQGHMIDVK
jgi:GTP-binding protein EngB required for normal cell division